MPHRHTSSKNNVIVFFLRESQSKAKKCSRTEVTITGFFLLSTSFMVTKQTRKRKIQMMCDNTTSKITKCCACDGPPQYHLLHNRDILALDIRQKGSRWLF